MTECIGYVIWRESVSTTHHPPKMDSEGRIIVYKSRSAAQAVKGMFDVVSSPITAKRLERLEEEYGTTHVIV